MVVGRLAEQGHRFTGEGCDRPVHRSQARKPGGQGHARCAGQREQGGRRQRLFPAARVIGMRSMYTTCGSVDLGT